MSKNVNDVKKQKELLIMEGAEKLKIIGFSNVTIHNILTDDIYQLYFLSFLKNRTNPKTDDEIIAIKELKSFINKLVKI